LICCFPILFLIHLFHTKLLLSIWFCNFFTTPRYIITIFHMTSCFLQSQI
jgi:hypothetical protein